MGTKKFSADVCTSCTQTKNYLLSLDRGAALIALAVSHAVGRLGRNRIHLQREMERDRKEFKSLKEMVEQGFMDSVMVRNAPRPRYHGLIAFQERGGGTGEYLLTPKGSRFTHGAKVPHVAIIDKVHHCNAGYWDEEGDQVTIFQLLKESSTWVLPKFQIAENGGVQDAMF